MPSSLIAEYGAVSEEVARALAEGKEEKSHTDIGIGITGIASPSGGSTKTRRIGTYWNIQFSTYSG